MAAVDAAAHTGIAKLGMHRIGEIDRRCALGQRDKISLGGETENLVLKQLELGMLKKFLRTVAFGQHFDQMPEPSVSVRLVCGHGLAVQGLFGIENIPIEGVSRDAVLSYFMHRLSADLHLDTHVMRADDSRVYRAVIVLLGRRDVVLETSRDHAPGLMNDAQGLVAVIN